MEKKEIKSESELESILEDLQNTIFSDESWVNNNFYKIPEITYSYEKISDDNIVNLSLFSDLGELDINDFKDADKAKKEELIINSGDKVIEKIQNKIEEIKKYIEKLEKINSGEDEVLQAKKEIILGGLKENIKFLNLSIEGIPFEQEKAIIGLHFKGNIEEKKKSSFYIDEENKKSKLEKINNLNTELFGEKISENKEYTEGNLDYLYEQYENYKNSLKSNKLEKERELTTEERERYEGYIAKLQAKQPEYKPKIREKPKSVIPQDLYDTVLTREEYVNNFNHNLTAHDKETKAMPHRSFIDPSLGNLTDTQKGTGVPSSEKYDLRSIIAYLKLETHEHEQHSIAQVSHETLIGNIRGEKKLEVVEGTAMLAEELLEYGENLYKEIEHNGEKVKIIDIDKISYLRSLPFTAMEEILTDEEFYDFLEIHNKIQPDIMSPKDRYLRHKRTGFQRKDITYTTGKIKVAKYINKIILGEIEGDFSDLYLGKVGFEDIPKLKIIKNSIENENNEKSEEEKIKLPENLFFAETVLFNLKNKNNGKNKNEKKEDFFNYLGNKYPFLNIEELKIKQTTFAFQKQLLGVLNNIEGAKKTNNEIKQIKKLKEKIQELKEKKNYKNNNFYEINNISLSYKIQILENKVKKEMKSFRKKSEKILNSK